MATVVLVAVSRAIDIVLNQIDVTLKRQRMTDSRISERKSYRNELLARKHSAVPRLRRKIDTKWGTRPPDRPGQCLGDQIRAETRELT